MFSDPGSDQEMFLRTVTGGGDLPARLWIWPTVCSHESGVSTIVHLASFVACLLACCGQRDGTEPRSFCPHLRDIPGTELLVVQPPPPGRLPRRALQSAHDRRCLPVTREMKCLARQIREHGGHVGRIDA